MIETLSEEVHKMWMKWAMDLMKTERFSSRRIKRWNKCFVPYAKLSNRMKELDRKIARKFIKIVKEAV